jgi:hypothetical protein
LEKFIFTIGTATRSTKALHQIDTSYLEVAGNNLNNFFATVCHRILVSHFPLTMKCLETSTVLNPIIKVKFVGMVLKPRLGWTVIAHTCNPTYLGD